MNRNVFHYRLSNPYFEICFVNQSKSLSCESNNAIINGSDGNGSPFALTAVAYI